jgi:acetyl esterase/lipase
MISWSTAWLCAALATRLSPALAQDLNDPPFTLPESVSMLPDLPYAGPDSQVLRLDLFRPKGRRGPFPAVVFVHGGGYVAGGLGAKSQFWLQSVYLAERGFVAATIGWRRAPSDGSSGARYPAALNDAQAAVRWLRAHAREYDVDVQRIAVAGGSSGGHIAALVATNLWSGSDWSGAPIDARVQAAVIFNGVLDVPGSRRHNLGEFLGKNYRADSALWQSASPMNHVTSQAAPFLLLHGTADSSIAYAQPVALQRRLRAVGVRAELFTADGADHGFFNIPPWYEPTTKRMAEFLLEVLK